MQKKMKRLALAAAMASLFAGASAAASAAVPDAAGRERAWAATAR